MFCDAVSDEPLKVLDGCTISSLELSSFVMLSMYVLCFHCASVDDSATRRCVFHDTGW